MPYSLLSDTELWDLFLKGDKKAFAHIYQKQYRLLLAYGIKLCDDPELVRDCIQDLFVKLHTNRKNLSPTLNINIYLICALKHRQRTVQFHADGDDRGISFRSGCR